MLFASVLLAASAAVVSAADHQIIVGGTNGFVFTPNSIVAAAQDTVTFEFQTKNHSVTQSSFTSPCALLTNTTTNAVGFDSGFVPVASNASSFPAWTIQITDATTPIWFYCAQTGHCEQGMVGAINAPTSGAKTFDAFVTNAKAGNTSTTTSGTTGGAGIGASASGSPSAASTSTPSGASRIAGSAGAALAAVAASLYLFA